MAGSGGAGRPAAGSPAGSSSRAGTAPRSCSPGKFTELFFLDEATAFSAGHRPCALCRREDYNRFLALVDEPGADAIDERLHEERLRRFHEPPARLPDGAFVLDGGEPCLVLATRCCPGRPPATACRARRRGRR